MSYHITGCVCINKAKLLNAPANTPDITQEQANSRALVGQRLPQLNLIQALCFQAQLCHANLARVVAIDCVVSLM
jgi:hypothetical protein